MRLLYLFAAGMMVCACHHDHVRLGPGPDARTPVPDHGAVSAPQAAEIPSSAAISKPDVMKATGGVSIHEPGEGHLQDIFFGYDRSDLSSAASAAVASDVKVLSPILADFPRVKIIVEGHCDERGSAEYNLALGDLRARSVSQALQNSGVPAAVLDTISYGKERPQCSESNENCWRKNRRAHIAFQQ